VNKNLISRHLKIKLLLWAIIMPLTIILINISCKKLDLERLVRFHAGDISEIRIFYVVVPMTILDVGETGKVQYGHCWSLYPNPNLKNSNFNAQTTSKSGQFNSILDDLNPHTVYYAVSYATDFKDTIYGEQINFSTKSNIGIQWVKSYGGSQGEGMADVITTSDGGFIIGGSTFSNDGDIIGNHGDIDVLIVKTDSIGELQWSKCFGGSSFDCCKSVAATSDGGYIFAAETRSNDGDVSGYQGLLDFWVVKISSSGEKEWQKCLGGSDDEDPNSIFQTKDGGYIVGGKSCSIDGDVSGNHGDHDYWIVKLDVEGNIQWQKSFGGSGLDGILSIKQTHDEGYILTGRSWSSDGDINDNHGNDDIWVVKINSSGSMEWNKSYGGPDNEGAKWITESDDNGYFIVGSTNSINGDVTGNKGNDDYWVIKIDDMGNIQWQKTLGGSDYDFGHYVLATSDGGCIVSGNSYSNDGDISYSYGDYDFWIAKLNEHGTLKWEKNLGGSLFESKSYIITSEDGGYIVCGNSLSNDGILTGNHGDSDIFIVKIKEE
jgi:hypothetical protein